MGVLIMDNEDIIVGNEIAINNVSVFFNLKKAMYLFIKRIFDILI